MANSANQEKFVTIGLCDQ